MVIKKNISKFTTLVVVTLLLLCINSKSSYLKDMKTQLQKQAIRQFLMKTVQKKEDTQINQNHYTFQIEYFGISYDKFFRQYFGDAVVTHYQSFNPGFFYENISKLQKLKAHNLKEIANLFNSFNQVNKEFQQYLTFNWNDQLLTYSQGISKVTKMLRELAQKLIFGDYIHTLSSDQQKLQIFRLSQKIFHLINSLQQQKNAAEQFFDILNQLAAKINQDIFLRHLGENYKQDFNIPDKIQCPMPSTLEKFKIITLPETFEFYKKQKNFTFQKLTQFLDSLYENGNIDQNLSNIPLGTFSGWRYYRNVILKSFDGKHQLYFCLNSLNLKSQKDKNGKQVVTIAIQIE